MTESIYKYWFENIDSNVYKRWIPINNSDNVISSVDQINTGKNLDIQFFDGNAKVTVDEIKKK